MTNSAYKRRLDFLRRNYANVVATLALFVALTGVGLVQAGVIVTSKQIRNGTILSQDIHKSAVKSSDIGTDAVHTSDIQNGAVESSDIAEGGVSSGDIGNGQVTPTDVSLPQPEELTDPAAGTGEPGEDFVKVYDAGSYTKETQESVLEVDWTGTVATDFASCVFQLRVDGQPSSEKGGEIFVANGQLLTIAASALFPGLGTGPHTVEVWARHPTNSFHYPCTVGPPNTGVTQTFVVSEQVF